MKVIDSISLRCIAHATEAPERVRSAMKFVMGEGELQVSNAHGYHGNRITIFSATLTRNRDIKRFWTRMKEFGIVDEILPRIDELVDDAGYLHLRFDKQEAYNGHIALTHGEDAIVLKMKIISYPWKKEMAIKNLIEYFNSMPV